MLQYRYDPFTLVTCYRAVCTPLKYITLIHSRTSLKENVVKMKKLMSGVVASKVFSYILISGPLSAPPTSTPFPTPSVHVCVFLWQPQDACTTAPMNRDVFYFSVQCLCINWAWRGARGCPVWLAACFGWRGRLVCLRRVLFRLLCADGAGENVTPQKQHELSCVNSK